MRLNIYIGLVTVVLSILGLSTNANAQERKITKGDKLYEQLAFIDAMEVYLEVAESGYKSEELFKRLGNTYYFNAKYDEASKWYGELFALNPNADAVYALRYSQSLRANGDNETSKRMYNQYLEKLEVKGLNMKAEDYLKIIHNNSGRYTLFPTSLSTNGIDFGTTFYGDKVIFASTKDTASFIKRRSAWDGLSFLDLFEATVNENGEFTSVSKLKGDVNTNKYHESSAVVTKDGKTMYFTRNNTTSNYKTKKNQHIHLKIYRAHLINGKWTDIEDLSINGDSYSTAHPVLNADDSRLYFVSDRPESIGQTDIFYSEIDNINGKLGKVINLGDKINTRGRESFPFISEDNELYFSSDGHYGLGGYDVFYSKMMGNDFGTILNVGQPINTEYDDFCFVINNHKGYVSSNRPNINGYDDIYSFVETKDIKDLLRSRVFGVVTDAETNAIISNATVVITDDEHNQQFVIETDPNGFYNQDIDINTNYIIKATKQGYEGNDAFAEAGIKERERNISLPKRLDTIVEGTDLAKLLNITIYFDLDKSNINPVAAVELEKIVAVMKQHPDLKIDVRSHTDSRANDAYNMALSDRRAKSTVAYIINRGISKERITGRGYGETELVNKCSNGVACSEVEHQANRRSEFIIIK